MGHRVGGGRVDRTNCLNERSGRGVEDLRGVWLRWNRVANSGQFLGVHCGLGTSVLR